LRFSANDYDALLGGRAETTFCSKGTCNGNARKTLRNVDVLLSLKEEDSG
jgi:hypothetical protein